jgi:predicted CopG family antitoxin
MWRELMRTTLVIDDDVLSAAKEMAAIENKSLGEVISSLARRALVPAESKLKARNGVPLLKVHKGGRRVTSELIQQLREDLP